MTPNPTLVMHLKGVSEEDALRETVERSIEKRVERIAEEFREVTRIEVTVAEDGTGFAAQGHVTGKNTEVATRADAPEARAAADAVLDKVERQLRRAHDKRIFSQRRDAQRDPPKRKEQR